MPTRSISSTRRACVMVGDTPAACASLRNEPSSGHPRGELGHGDRVRDVARAPHCPFDLGCFQVDRNEFVGGAPQTLHAMSTHAARRTRDHRDRHAHPRSGSVTRTRPCGAVGARGRFNGHQGGHRRPGGTVSLPSP